MKSSGGGVRVGEGVGVGDLDLEIDRIRSCGFGAARCPETEVVRDAALVVARSDCAAARRSVSDLGSCASSG